MFNQFDKQQNQAAGMDEMRHMTRTIFLKRAVQAGLLALLALIVFSLRNRIVAGNACDGCPEYGRCGDKENCTR